MSTSDAPVIQLESRKLCLSLLFGTRKSKVAGATNPTTQAPDIIQHKSHTKFLSSMLSSTRDRECIPCAIPNNSIHMNVFPVIL